MMKAILVAVLLSSQALAAVPRTSAAADAATGSEAERNSMADAIYKGDTATAKKLHKKGVSFDAVSSADEMTGLMRLADDGDTAGVDRALKLGSGINARNSHLESALWYATYSGHEKLALSLIARGASAAGQRPDSKECLMHMAVQADLTALTKKLMKLTPKCALVKDVDGKTPNAVAKALGYTKLAKITAPKK